MNAKIAKSTTKVPTAKKPSRGRPATPEEVEAAKKGAPITEEPATTEAPAPEPEAALAETTTKSSKAKAAKAEKSTEQPGGDQKPTPPPGELVVFALRMTLDERQRLHETAGPAKASKFARMILTAAANRDVDQICEIIEATTPKQ